MTRAYKVAGLFAGIGGLEIGMERAGHRTVLLNEVDPIARAVLSERFPSVRLTQDVRNLRTLPKVDVLTAGFPCTDISQAGRKVGIEGQQSGLVNEIFRLIEAAKQRPEWIVLENVSYLLKLNGGRGLGFVLQALEALGYGWAYRVVDARAFGVPQRRQRVIIVASLSQDPRTVLFSDNDEGPDYDDSVGSVERGSMYGFYWTEGFRGLGWTKDAVPTVKGGSGLGIPSAPAIWDPETGTFGTPSIEDGERLQGFPTGWTELPDFMPRSLGARWKQVGNAVCVPMSEWIGKRLASPGTLVEGNWSTELTGGKWPAAGYGLDGKVYVAPVSTRPFRPEYKIGDFLMHDLKPLSFRAASGFASRAARSTTLRFADGFLDSLDEYISVRLAA
ncbi:DNA cytosine methyltransferase [Arthrobacter cupressi]